ncbi:MAG: TonB-dependent receptor [Steroidobacteraceae bacterium]
MTTRKVTSTSRSVSGKGSRQYLISVAVAAAIAVSSAPRHSFAADASTDVPAPAAQDQAITEVVVTGSRIKRTRDLDAPSPITTISSETLENSSSTGIESVLNQQPQFVPQNTQFTSGVQSSPTQTPGAATLSLRGLGSNRNLVLVDGQRWQPTNATLAVDVNTIPVAAVESVETITGGASAVYGPDAMAGVVNFVLKKNFQGVDVDIQRGETAKGDGGETRASVLMGMNGVDGRGNMMLGLDWTKRDPVYQDNRSFYSDGWIDPGHPSGGFIYAPSYAPASDPSLPSQAALNAAFPTGAPGTVTPGTQVYFNADGTPFVSIAGGLGYDGPLNSLAPGRYSAITLLNGQTSSPNNLSQSYTGGYVSVPLERHSLFAHGTFNFNDYVSAYGQINYSNIQVETQGAGPSPAITIWATSIPRYNSATPGAPQDSTWLPPSLLALLNSRSNPNANWTLYQSTDYLGGETVLNSTNVWQATAGLKGKLPFRDWTWDIYGSQGQTHDEADYTGLPSLQRLAYLDALPDFGKGASISSPPGTPFGYGESCTSGLPVFQSFTPSADCVQSITDPLKNESTLKQTIVEGYIQGMLWQLPAGEARFDLGATYRGDEYNFSPGNPVGAITDNPVGVFPSNYTGGDISVKEAYTELLIPVLKRLELELGYRESDFNTAGDKGTYKAMFTWKALDELTFRGGFQAATRAPNVAELYTGPTQNVVFFPQEDPCSATTLAPWGNVASNPNRLKVQGLCEALIGNMTSQFNTQTYNAATLGSGPNGWTRQSPTFFPLEIEVNTGNPKVKPEVGRTFTFGAVITDPFGVSGLTSTVDLYRIVISDTISPESSITVYNDCFNYNGSSNPTYSVTNPSCQLIQRNPITGDRASVTALYSNLGTLKTQGLDLALNWAHEFGPGTFAAGTDFNYINEFEYQTQPGSPFVNAKGTLDTVAGAAGAGGLFDYRAITHIQYTWQALTAGLGWEHLSSIKDASASTNPTTKVLGVPAYNLFNFYSNYDFGKVSVRFGIDNLFNKQPLVVGNDPGVTDASGLTNPGLYDPLGIRFYVGVKATL